MSTLVKIAKVFNSFNSKHAHSVRGELIERSPGKVCDPESKKIQKMGFRYVLNYGSNFRAGKADFDKLCQLGRIRYLEDHIENAVKQVASLNGLLFESCIEDGRFIIGIKNESCLRTDCGNFKDLPWTLDQFKSYLNERKAKLDKILKGIESLLDLGEVSQEKKRAILSTLSQ